MLDLRKREKKPEERGIDPDEVMMLLDERDELDGMVCEGSRAIRSLVCVRRSGQMPHRVS